MDDVYDLVVIGVMSRSLPPRVVTGQHQEEKGEVHR